MLRKQLQMKHRIQFTFIVDASTMLHAVEILKGAESLYRFTAWANYYSYWKHSKLGTTCILSLDEDNRLTVQCSNYYKNRNRNWSSNTFIHGVIQVNTSVVQWFLEIYRLILWRLFPIFCRLKTMAMANRNAFCSFRASNKVSELCYLAPEYSIWILSSIDYFRRFFTSGRMLDLINQQSVLFWTRDKAHIRIVTIILLLVCKWCKIVANC